jgi:MFS superfamily sulfate permease-like transporter
VIGFTNAAAIIITTSQLDKIFGLRVEKATHHYETVIETVRAAISSTHWPTVAMAVGAFAILMGLRRVNPRIPNVLVAVVVTSATTYAAFEHVQSLRSRKSTALQRVGSLRTAQTLSRSAQLEKDIAGAKQELDQARKHTA